MRTASVTLAGLLVVNGALAVALSMSEAPERPPHPSSEPVTLHLTDGWADYQASLSRRPDGTWPATSALAWTNAFGSEAAGPEGTPVTLTVEAAPSPLHAGATLVRVLVQADRRARPALEDVRLRLDFFPFEVSAWRAPEQRWWEAASTPLLATLDLPAAGAARVLFVEADARSRYGASLGVATLTARGDEGRLLQLVAPLERGHRELDDASLDFRFFAAVFTAAEVGMGTRVDFETIEALLADSTTGQPAREAFAEQGLRRVEAGLIHRRPRDWGALGY